MIGPRRCVPGDEGRELGEVVIPELGRDLDLSRVPPDIVTQGPQPFHADLKGVEVGVVVGEVPLVSPFRGKWQVSDSYGSAADNRRAGVRSDD